MRLASLLLLVSGFPMNAARLQQPVTAAAQAGAPRHPVHRVMAPPASATVQGPGARSTAQEMAAHTSPPLLQMPSFTTTGLDGKAADVNSFHTSGHWLLLYRAEHCLACDKVMTALAKSESPLLLQGTPYVIVVRGNGASSGMLDAMKAAYPTLSNAAWVEDTGGAGFAALKPHGEPVLYALSGDDIAWALHGTLRNPATLEKLASGWLASTARPHPAVGTAGSAKPAATSIRRAPAVPSH